MRQKKPKSKDNLALAKKTAEMPVINTGAINEAALFERVAAIIINRKSRIESHVNAELTLIYWETANSINSAILDGGRGKYVKQILATLSPKLSWSQIVLLLPLKTHETRLCYAIDVDCKAQPSTEVYDLIIGPVANDATLSVINDYMDGIYTKEEAVIRLLPQNLTDQYAFLTNIAVALLSFEGSEQQ